DLMSVYRRRLDLTDEAADQVEILQGMADIAERQAGDVETAIERYREALELDEENETTLRELHRLYADRENYDDLADVLRRQIALIEERAEVRPPHQAQPFDPQAFISGEAFVEEDADAGGEFAEEQLVEDGSGAASIEEDSRGELADVSSAAEAVEASAEQVAEEAFESSDAAYDSELSDAEDVSEAELIEEASDAALEAISEAEAAISGAYAEGEIERLVELRYELGVVAKEHLGDDEEAVESLDAVLAWRPLHRRARHELEEYLDDSRFRNRVAERLTPVYELQGMWSSLVDALEIRREEAEEDDEVISLLERIGHVETFELGRAEDAFETYSRLLRFDPANETARRQLLRVTATVGWWEEAVELYEELYEELDDDELRVEYLFDLGEMYADRLEDPDTAQELYHRVLEVDEESPRALTELEALYSDTEQWDQLRGIYDRQLELAETTEQIEELQFRIAVLHERLLDEPHEAIDVLKEMLAERPDNLRAVRMLERLYRGQQMWHEVSDNLQRELELVEPEDENEVKNRLAEVLAEHLDEYDEAVDLYEEVLEDDSGNERAIAALEELMRQDRPSAARASRILEPLYVERDDFERVIEALEVQADFADEVDEQVELLHRIAELHEERAGRTEAAFDTYCRALSVRVDDEETLEHLYRIADAIAYWDELAVRLEGEAESQVDPEVKRDLLWRAASVCIENLDDLERAAELLRRVHDLFAEDLETVEKLEELYRKLQDFERLVDILVIKAELVDEGDQKKELWYQAATTYEEVLEQPSEAVEVYRRVLEFDEADAHSIDRLEVLFTELERWQELLEVYERKLELADDDEARKDLLYAMGPIYREHLDAPFEAIETYRKILEIDDAELAALEKLDELLAETDQFNELLEVLERQMELVALDEDRLDLQYRVGRLWEEQLGDALRAIEVYREVLDEDPTHAATTEALEDLITRGEYEAQAAEVLQPIYEEADEWEKLVRIYGLLIEASADPERKLEIYTEVAGICEERLDDPHRAFETYV
ncbi:MAG: tetratricopeptide repeat protein, partial [Persicimonas sp.]